ncbi:MAG: hypothetical protein ACOYT4_04280 [Nanoarchaeota archaeon]
MENISQENSYLERLIIMKPKGTDENIEFLGPKLREEGNLDLYKGKLEEISNNKQQCLKKISDTFKSLVICELIDYINFCLDKEMTAFRPIKWALKSDFRSDLSSLKFLNRDFTHPDELIYNVLNSFTNVYNNLGEKPNLDISGKILGNEFYGLKNLFNELNPEKNLESCNIYFANKRILLRTNLYGNYEGRMNQNPNYQIFKSNKYQSLINPVIGYVFIDSFNNNEILEHILEEERKTIKYELLNGSEASIHGANPLDVFRASLNIKAPKEELKEQFFQGKL